MSILTNGIATEDEAKTKLGYTGTVTTNKCCTKARAVTMGADSTKLTGYTDDRLVKYEDLVKSANELYIDLYIMKSYGTFYLKKRSNIPTPVVTNLRLEYDSGSDTYHDVEINQGYYESGRVAYATYSYPVAWTVISFTPTEFTYSGVQFVHREGYIYNV